jgi:hypothetical protein
MPNSHKNSDECLVFHLIASPSIAAAIRKQKSQDEKLIKLFMNSLDIQCWFYCERITTTRSVINWCFHLFLLLWVRERDY